MDLRQVPERVLTVAAGQAGSAGRDVAGTVALAADLVRRAADAGADLVVLPELFIGGYELARPVTGAPLHVLATACAQTRTAVVVGAATGDGGAPRISALVLGRDGTLAGRYDKQHLDPGERAAGFEPGRQGGTVTIDGWRLGLGICWDSSFPEHARAAALDGTHAYLVGGLFEMRRKMTTLLPARAWDNASYLVAANHRGPSGPYVGCGGSAVWDPHGTMIADAGSDDPGLAVARLDPGVLAAARAGDLPLADPSLDVPVRARREISVR
jgi:predicted amidohydrolase